MGDECPCWGLQHVNWSRLVDWKGSVDCQCFADCFVDWASFSTLKPLKKLNN
ncbi:hypothetical protein DPMN_119707 [Dreissena polymorpha]|uniref:Uncharacterized protein n=1 Tax=Dreissena polymorpha TaxID=45954 RepID=A0A9D4GMG9_DREPO|nr:hypothetical protein DPMN_119707 [Dreissena polymorpha]